MRIGLTKNSSNREANSVVRQWVKEKAYERAGVAENETEVVSFSNYDHVQIPWAVGADL